MSSSAAVAHERKQDTYSESFEDESEEVYTGTLESSLKHKLSSLSSSSSSFVIQPQEPKEKLEESSKENADDHKPFTQQSFSSSMHSSSASSSSSSSADVYVRGSKADISASALEENEESELKETSDHDADSHVDEESYGDNNDSNSISSIDIDESKKQKEENVQNDYDELIASNEALKLNTESSRNENSSNNNEYKHIKNSVNNSSISSSSNTRSEESNHALQKSSSAAELLMSSHSSDLSESSSSVREIEQLLQSHNDEQETSQRSSKHSLSVSSTESEEASASDMKRTQEPINKDHVNEDWNEDNDASSKKNTGTLQTKHVVHAAETDKDYYYYAAAADGTSNNNNNNNNNNEEYPKENDAEDYSSSVPTPRPHAAAGKRRVNGTRLNDGALGRLGQPWSQNEEKRYKKKVVKKKKKTRNNNADPKAPTSRSTSRKLQGSVSKRQTHKQHQHTQSSKQRLLEHQQQEQQQQQQRTETEYTEWEHEQQQEQQYLYEEEQEELIISNQECSNVDKKSTTPKGTSSVEKDVITVEPAAIPQTVEEMNIMQRSNDELREKIFAIQRKRYERMQRPQIALQRQDQQYQNSSKCKSNSYNKNSGNNNAAATTGAMSVHYAATMPIFTSSQPSGNAREQMNLSRREATIRAIQETVLLDEMAHMLKREQVELQEKVIKLRDLIRRYERGKIYNRLIAEANNDIALLNDEHRELELQMRFNDRLLVSNEQVMESGEGERRLRDELHAQTALCERALLRALREYEDAERQRSGFVQKVNTMEEELEKKRSAFTPEALEELNTLRRQEAEQRHEIAQIMRKLNEMQNVSTSSHSQKNRVMRQDVIYGNVNKKSHASRINNTNTLPNRQVRGDAAMQKFVERPRQKSSSQKRELSQQHHLHHHSHHHHHHQGKSNWSQKQSNNKNELNEDTESVTSHDDYATEKDYLTERIATLKAQLNRLQTKKQNVNESKSKELHTYSSMESTDIPASNSKSAKHTVSASADSQKAAPFASSSAKEKNTESMEVELTPAPIQDTQHRTVQKEEDDTRKCASINENNTNKEIRNDEIKISDNNKVENKGEEHANKQHNWQEDKQKHEWLQDADNTTHVNAVEQIEKEKDESAGTAMWLDNMHNSEEKVKEGKIDNNINTVEPNKSQMHDKKEAIVAEETIDKCVDAIKDEHAKESDLNKEFQEEVHAGESAIEQQKQEHHEEEKEYEEEEELEEEQESELEWEKDNIEEMTSNVKDSMKKEQEQEIKQKSVTEKGDSVNDKLHEWLDIESEEIEKEQMQNEQKETYSVENTAHRSSTKDVSVDEHKQIGSNEETNAKDDSSGPSWLDDDNTDNNAIAKERLQSDDNKRDAERASNELDDNNTSTVKPQEIKNDVRKADRANATTENKDNNLLDKLFADKNSKPLWKEEEEEYDQSFESEEEEEHKEGEQEQQEEELQEEQEEYEYEEEQEDVNDYETEDAEEENEQQEIHVNKSNDNSNMHDFTEIAQDTMPAQPFQDASEEPD